MVYASKTCSLDRSREQRSRTLVCVNTLARFLVHGRLQKAAQASPHIAPGDSQTPGRGLNCTSVHQRHPVATASIAATACRLRCAAHCAKARHRRDRNETACTLHCTPQPWRTCRHRNNPKSVPRNRRPRRNAPTSRRSTVSEARSLALSKAARSARTASASTAHPAGRCRLHKDPRAVLEL